MAANDADDVIDSRQHGRFELTVDGRLSELRYQRGDGTLRLVHTEVPDALGGQGIGGRLVRAAVDAAARDGLTIVPRCPFARDWLERHPDEAARATIAWD